MLRPMNLIVGTLTCSLVTAAVLVSPQARLGVRLAAGEFEHRAVPVAALVPVGVDELTLRMRLGHLRFDLPPEAAAAIDPRAETSAEQNVVCLRWEGVGLIAHRPRCDGVPRLRYELNLDRDTCSRFDEVSLRAAAYAADVRATSWLTGSLQARRLTDLLSIRQLLYTDVDRILTIRGESIKGVLVLRTFEDNQTSLILDYFSTDESLSGMVALTVDGRSEQAMHTALAILSSFRLVGTP